MHQIARSPRHPSDLCAVLVDGPVQSAGRVHDVSRSGLLVKGPAGLRVGRRLQVVRLVDDTEGSRRTAEVVRLAGRDSAGLRFLEPAAAYALPHDAPLLYLAEAWDDEGGWLAPLPSGGSSPSARFAVRPTSLERLRRFAERDLRGGGTVLFTRELRPAGARVAVVLVHPLTGAELELPAVVVRAQEREPRHLELAFLTTDEQALLEFERFAASGHPRPLLLAPPLDEADSVRHLAEENARLRARVAELEEALAESERTERSFLQRLQECERLAPRAYSGSSVR